MRREPFKIASVLKFVGIYAAIGLFLLFVRPNSYENLKYELSQIDPLYVIIAVVILLLIFVPPVLRLRRERRIWMVLAEPFEIDRDPFIDIDHRTEAYGDVSLGPDVHIKHVAIHVTKNYIYVRKAAYPKLFPTFKVAWSSVSNVYFVATTNAEFFGKDDVGIARITLSFSEETILVLPWRARFNGLVPDSAGFQKESVIR